MNCSQDTCVLGNTSKRISTKGIRRLYSWAAGRAAQKASEGKTANMEKRIIKALNEIVQGRKNRSLVSNLRDTIADFAAFSEDFLPTINRHVAYLRKHNMPKRAQVWEDFASELNTLLEGANSLLETE